MAGSFSEGATMASTKPEIQRILDAEVRDTDLEYQRILNQDHREGRFGAARTLIRFVDYLLRGDRALEKLCTTLLTDLHLEEP
jgi:hypothetical protein